MISTVIREDGDSTTTMIHHSDFSGTVEIVLGDRYGEPPQEWRIPGWIVKAIREDAVQRVLEWLEDFPLCDIELE